MTEILNAGSYDYTIGSLVSLVSKGELKIQSEETLSNEDEAKLIEQLKRGVVFNSLIINNRNPRGKRDIHLVTGASLLNSIISIYNANLVNEIIELDLIENISVRVIMTLNENEDVIKNIMF